MRSGLCPPDLFPSLPLICYYGGMGSLRKLALSIAGRIGLFSELFSDGSDNSDVYRVLGYRRKITYSQYRARYRRGGLAYRLVNFLPDKTWVGGVYLLEDEDPKITTRFEQTAENLFSRLNVPSVFRRADIMAGIGNYAGVLIGARGDLSTPLPRMRSELDIQSLDPIPQDRLQIKTLETNLSSVRYGLPLYYRIRPTSQKNDGFELLEGFSRTASDTAAKDVHWSRIIHTSKNCVENPVLGIPELQPVWNLLDDLQRLTGGGAKSAWSRMLSKVLLDIDKSFEPEDEEIDRIEKELKELYDDEKSYALTRAVTPKQTQGPVFNFAANVQCVISQIAGTKGIPVRDLNGSERGKIADDEDRTLVSDLINAHRTLNCNQWIRDFAERIVLHGALPKPKKFVVHWYEEEIPIKEQDKAGIVLDITRANEIQLRRGDTEILTSAEMRDLYYKRKPLKLRKQKSFDKGSDKQDKSGDKDVDDKNSNDKDKRSDQPGPTP